MQLGATGLVQKLMSLQFLQLIQKLLGWDTILVRHGRRRKGKSYHPLWGSIDCDCHLYHPLRPPGSTFFLQGLWSHLMIMRRRLKEGIQTCFVKVTFLETRCPSLKIAVLGWAFSWFPLRHPCSGLTLLQSFPVTPARGIFLQHPFPMSLCLGTPRTLSHLQVAWPSI